MTSDNRDTFILTADMLVSREQLARLIDDDAITVLVKSGMRPLPAKPKGAHLFHGADVIEFLSQIASHNGRANKLDSAVYDSLVEKAREKARLYQNQKGGEK